MNTIPSQNSPMQSAKKIYGFRPMAGKFDLPYKEISLTRMGIDGWPAIYHPDAKSENYDFCLDFLGWGNPPGIFQEDLTPEERKYLRDLFAS